ncbi:MAG: hypothetical protein HY033_13940 [Ignavibacteriae bacterium]|nr:hypothetical protein [Ignavibacteriota bacterium]
MKQLACNVLVVLVAIYFVSCAPKATTNEDKSYVPSFHYTPTSNAVAASAEVTFAVVNASYSENQPWTSMWPFTDFSKNMGLDFQQILSSRGFTVKGPFGAYDEMTFPDKKGSDLVLQPTLDVRLDITDTKYKENVKILGSNTYTLVGQAAIGGRVTLSLMESLSKERMWFKSIDIPREMISWEGEKEYSAPPSQADLSDPGIVKPLGPKLEAIYTKVMEAAWKYLDPEEMKLVKKQAEEIKKKKVY